MSPYLDCDERGRFDTPNIKNKTSTPLPTPLPLSLSIHTQQNFYTQHLYLLRIHSLIYSPLLSYLIKNISTKSMNEKQTKFIEYVEWKKDYSYKHIVCFGDSPNDLCHIYYGHEHVNGGTYLNIIDEKAYGINSLDKICGCLSKSNTPCQKIKPAYTNFIPNLFVKFFGDKNKLQRYDIYYKSNCRNIDDKN